MRKAAHVDAIPFLSFQPEIITRWEMDNLISCWKLSHLTHLHFAVARDIGKEVPVFEVGRAEGDFLYKFIGE